MNIARKDSWDKLCGTLRSADTVACARFPREGLLEPSLRADPCQVILRALAPRLAQTKLASLSGASADPRAEGSRQGSATPEEFLWMETALTQ